MSTGYIFPAEIVGVVGVTEISWVEDVDVPLVNDLDGESCTLLSGLLKKLSQFSA